MYCSLRFCSLLQHASHVTMSTSKLLSRIVNTDGEDGEVRVTSTFNAGDVKLANGNQRRHAHETSYGITSNPLTQFSIVFAALIHDVRFVFDLAVCPIIWYCCLVADIFG
jgi:hypothetical protein